MEKAPQAPKRPRFGVIDILVMMGWGVVGIGCLIFLGWLIIPMVILIKMHEMSDEAGAENRAREAQARAQQIADKAEADFQAWARRQIQIQANAQSPPPETGSY